MNYSLIVALLAGLPSLSLVSGIVLMTELKKFMAGTPRIETGQDLEHFKKIVKHQMYAALLQIVLLGTPVFIFSYGIQKGILGFGDILYVIVPNSIVIALGLILKKLEKKGQSISASTPELRSEVDSVVYFWKKKALPNW
ncbi:MAG: hypothetical protein KAH31_00670 [Candidatus Sabulitectum sp.]|nr:hypothetical protein [Candidatus Sabulitectum sp.]